MCVFAYCVFVGTLISVVARCLLSCVAMPLPPDVDEWCVRIRALRVTDAELSVGSGSRVESLARVLAANEFSGVRELAWAAHPSSWLEADNLRKPEVAFLERLWSRRALHALVAYIS